MIIDKIYSNKDELIGFIDDDKVHILHTCFKQAREALIDKYKHFVLLSEAELAVTKPAEKTILI